MPAKYMNSILKHPSAWLPIALSLVMLVYIIVYLSVFGIIYHKDEGAPAHLFQIWLVLEIFLIAFFAIKWIARNPKQALIILALQIVCALMPMSIVFFLKL